ncbi:MAG: biopolymer transporter ExbD [Candidatus Latescibacterota bacterium]
MKKRKKRPGTEFAASAMSDIAFLLLIFFLVTTIFAVEQGIPLALPGQESKNVKVNRKNLLVIKAYPNGSITMDKDPITIKEIRAAIEQKLAENDKLIVVIETHPDSEYGTMIDILDELKLANARTVSLKTMN